jgi:transposase InsO family protein
MKAQDVSDTLDLVLAKSGLDLVNVGHRPRLLSDNGSSYISADLAEWIKPTATDVHAHAASDERMDLQLADAAPAFDGR